MLYKIIVLGFIILLTSCNRDEPDWSSLRTAKIVFKGVPNSKNSCIFNPYQPGNTTFYLGFTNADGDTKLQQEYSSSDLEWNPTHGYILNASVPDKNFGILAYAFGPCDGCCSVSTLDPYNTYPIYEGVQKDIDEGAEVYYIQLRYLECRYCQS